MGKRTTHLEHGVLRRSALILRSFVGDRERWYAYDRKTRKQIGSSWRKGRLKQIVRERGYRWPSNV